MKTKNLLYTITHPSPGLSLFCNTVIQEPHKDLSPTICFHGPSGTVLM